MRKALHGGVAAIALCASDVATAEVATDGTMGAKVRFAGRDVTIGADLGTIRGKNLFHSFERFDIETGGSATFTGPAGLDRVISRVTGGKASSIDGTLRSTVPGADVYLVNPSGILFGPNARLDVPASFHASTADELRFPDGGVFSASNPERTLLSVAAPETFGFLGAHPASITLNQGRLEVGTGKSLSLVGGAIAVTGDGVPLSGTGALRAPGGELTLASVGGKGAVSLAGDDAFFDPGNKAFRLGAIDIAAVGALDSSGDGGGKIRVRTGRLTMATGAMLARNEGPTDATGGITVAATAMELGASSAILAAAFDSGKAGDVAIRAGSLRIDNLGGELGAFILTDAAGFDGAAGALSLEIAGRLDIAGGGVVGSSTSGNGAAGSVTVSAGKLTIDGAGSDFFTGITSDANPGSTSAAGEITVRVADRLAIRTGGEIGSNTVALGDAGRVTVTAGSILVDGSAASRFTGISSSAVPGSEGNAGSVLVAARDGLSLVEGGLIGSDTFAAGAAGSITVEAGKVRIDRASGGVTGITSNALQGSSGPAGKVTVTARDSLRIRRGGGIASDTFAAGDAGTVTVEAANEVALRSGGAISSATFSGGSAGSVAVTSGNLLIDARGSAGLTGITSQAAPGSTGEGGQISIRTGELLRMIALGRITSDTFSSGNAGEVTVQAGAIDARLGSVISSSTLGQGDAGVVTVRADRILLDAQARDLFTGITSQATPGSGGAAGEVNVLARDSLRLVQGAEISSSTFAPGDAGRVVVRAGRLTLDGSGTPFFTDITSSAEQGSNGRAGEVEVKVDGRLQILNGAEISTSTFAVGDAGEVTVRAGSLLIDGSTSGRISGIASNALAGASGAAGEVTVAARGNILIEQGGIKSSSFGTGPAGDVTVTAADLAVEDGFVRSIGIEDLGGRVAIRAARQISLVGASISTNGTLPEGDASVITLEAPTVVVVGESRVTALTGDGEPLTGSGVIGIRSKRTLISEDSRVEASSDVTITGVVNSLRTPARIAAETPTDPSRLLRDCAEERLGGRGSFKATGRGGLPASPEEFLIGRPAKGTEMPVRVASSGC